MIISDEWWQTLEEAAKIVEIDISDIKSVKKKKLSDVVALKSGKDWRSLNIGNIPVYGSGGEMGVFVDKVIYDKPTVLIPLRGTMDNVYYLDKPFWNVDTTFHTEINTEIILPKYLYYYLSNFDLKSICTGSGRLGTTKGKIENIKIVIPPLNIQKHIIEFLDNYSCIICSLK